LVVALSEAEAAVNSPNLRSQTGGRGFLHEADAFANSVAKTTIRPISAIARSVRHFLTCSTNYKGIVKSVTSNHMHRKLKVLIAGWLASRIESRTRRVRRALRDHQRAELRRIHDSDRRARGLRLYTAWSCKENKAMNDRTVVPLPLVQPVVSDDVAAAMADVAVEEPLNGTVEVAGPEPIRLDELVQGFLSANRDARKVTTDVHALYPRR
jgi:hypothetical protein